MADRRRRLAVSALITGVVLGGATIPFFWVDAADAGLRSLVILLTYPGIILHGWVSGSYDGAFDSLGGVMGTIAISWLFWTTIVFSVLTLLSWLNPLGRQPQERKG